MKTKVKPKASINIVTLGCSKNLVDSEVLYTQLKGNGLEVTHEAKKDTASIVVVNTCGFIDNAKAESVNTILEYADKKSRGIADKVFVTGCLSERYRPDLEKEIPNVDQYFGTTELLTAFTILAPSFIIPPCSLCPQLFPTVFLPAACGLQHPHTSQWHCACISLPVFSPCCKGHLQARMSTYRPVPMYTALPLSSQWV